MNSNGVLEPVLPQEFTDYSFGQKGENLPPQYDVLLFYAKWQAIFYITGVRISKRVQQAVSMEKIKHAWNTI